MDQEIARALSQTNFTALDWGIVAVYLSVSVLIGLKVKKYVGNMTDYVTAGRGVGAALGVATMTGTEMGLVTVMYSAQKGFVGGFAAFHIALIAGIMTLIVAMTGFIVRGLRQHEVLTIPEFYERRFGKRVRVLGGVMLALGGVLNMGLFLKVGSMFIVGITGLSANGKALPIVMTILLVLVLVYTVLGGMISVIITDYIQFVVLAIGILVATGLAIANLGWGTIFDVVTAEMGEKGFNPLVADSAFGLEYVIWMAFLGMVGCAIWPTAVARALAMDSVKSLKQQYMWSSVSFLIRFIVPYFWGICAFVFIMTKAPDLAPLFLEAGEEAAPLSNLYAMPVFMGRILPAGLIGIISAAMIAAFMSTHDSYLLCWSSVITQDIVAPLRKTEMTPQARIKLTRILIVIIGIYILYWGLCYSGGEDIWDYMAITGAIYFTGAFAVLWGGLYWRRASSTGAFLALLSGLTAILGLQPVLDLVQKLTGKTISGHRFGIASIILACLTMVIGSLVFPDRDAPANVAETASEGGDA